jgi:rod shape-determining protein MreD
MQPTVWQKVDSMARRILPFGLTMIVLLFGLTPTHIPGLAQITPMYTLIAVYFWSTYRPDLLGYGPGFAIGILEDLLTGAPLGACTLTLLLAQWLIFNRQKFFYTKARRPSAAFVVTWLIFALVSFSAVFLRWIIIGLMAENGLTPIGDLFAAYLITVTMYPVIAWMFSKVHTGLLDEP